MTSPAFMLAAATSDSFMSQIGFTIALATLPFVAIAGTSFIKISLVLSILRSALGAPGMLPASVLTALAGVLSAFVMAPVGGEIMKALRESPPLATDDAGFSKAVALYDAASPPLIRFLQANTPQKEIDFFVGLTKEKNITAPGLRILLPAFATSEVGKAFQIGFLLFLPFLVVDLIVANTLLALGMSTLSPLAVALPLKLLLFITVDGWHLLLNGLLMSYAF